MKKRVLLRADGSQRIGFGHLYRVFALAENLKANFNCLLVTSHINELVINETKRLDISIINVSHFEYTLPNERTSTQEVPFDMESILEKDDIVIIDGYWFGIEYQNEIKKRGCFLICIDDLTTGEFNVDAIINHAPGIQATNYHEGVQTKLYLGLDYMILRPSFFKNINKNREATKSIYLSFGGSDFYGLSLKFLKMCLKATSQFKIHLLTSSSFQNDLINELSELRKENDERVFLHQNLNGAEISDLIDKCTHAITASSTVALEVVARGIKPLIGYYSDNQKNIYNGLINEGLAYGAGNLLNCDNLSITDYLQSIVYSERQFNNKKLMGIFDFAMQQK